MYEYQKLQKPLLGYYELILWHFICGMIVRKLRVDCATYFYLRNGATIVVYIKSLNQLRYTVSLYLNVQC